MKQNKVAKKLLLVLLCFMGIFGSVKAQVSVTATAGTVGPTPYTTLKAAFDAINAGTHQGTITVTISNPGTTETATAILNTSAAPSNYLSVTVKPAAAANPTITGNVSPSIIKLNGADNVTIDGSNNGTASRNLTISNSSTSTTTGVIWVASASGADGAGNNIIKNCIVTGNAPTTTLAAIAQSSGTTLGGLAETANSNNTYSNNAVSTAMYGIGVVGANGNEDAQTVISGNSIGSATAGNKMGHAGIFLAQQKNVLVTGNTIFGITSNAGNFTFQTSGIFVGGTIASGGTIEKNKISDVRIASVWGCNGIQLNSSTAVTNLVIANNFIWDISAGGFTTFDTVDDNGTGIAVVTGGGYKIQYNSIDLSSGSNQSGLPCITSAFWVGQGIAASSLDVRDNIFSNRQTNGAARYAIYSNSGTSCFTTINYNDYFSTGQVGFQGSIQATLANWQSATGQDANSVAIDPSYTSTSDLHLFFNSPLDGIATPIAGITQDIDGDTRTATPDIGADEFTPPNCTNPVNNNFPATGSVTDICASGSSVLSASGYSYGVGISYQWEVSTVSCAAGFGNLAGQTNPISGNTGTINATHYYRLRVQCSGGAFGYSQCVTVNVNNPAVTSPTGGTRCGVGTVSLSATGSNLHWYSAATGGSSIGSGSPFTTPVISSTTTFYVTASNISTPFTGGKPSTAGGDGGYNGTDVGLIFDATQAFTLDSVKMYPQAAGTVVVSLENNTGTVLFSTPPIVFAGATSTGVYVPLGFNVPIGTGYRLVLTSNSSGMIIWRDFAGVSFPYILGTVGSITTGWISGTVNTYYYFYDWHITPTCESTRTPVVATVTPPPAFTSVTPPNGYTICGGTSVTLNSTGGGYTTVAWNPGNLPNGTVVTPAVTTTYTLTGNIPGGCRRDSVVTIIVNSPPTTLIDSVHNASVCPNTLIRIGTSGGLIPGQTVFTELAENPAFPQWTLSNTGSSNVNLNQNTTYFQQGAGSIWLTHGDFSDGALATTSSLNMTGYSNVQLTFWQIAGLEASGSFHYDKGYIEYSSDGGGSWNKIPNANYAGSGTSVDGTFIAFDNTSYSDWDAQFSSGASTPGIAPATSMWKQETINISNAWLTSTFKLRFHLTTDVSIQYYGWLIDNIKLAGTHQACITWSPQTNLWQDAAHTIPVTGASCNSTVYFYAPSAGPTVTYTATATAGAGCVTTDTSRIGVSNSSTSSVSIAASPSGAICSGTCVTFTATPTNGGTPPGYNWLVNGSTVSGGSQVGMNVITLCNLNNGDIVTCAMSRNPNVGGCVTGPDPVTSNAINMVVNPTPTANNISGSSGSTVCTGAPNLLTETAVGTISTYQWYLNGSPVGTNSNTYSATVAGTYSVAVTSNMGCKDTSNDFIITQPTNTITATAGPNGTISPSGAVSVPCGSSQVFTITPNAGYSVLDVLVNGVSVGPVTTYTFNNVTGDSTISVTFYLPGCASPATSNAGSDASICAGSSYTLSGAVGGAASSGTWSTPTGGTFTPNATTLNASWTPPGGFTGIATLTLTTDDPPGSCPVSTSSIDITVKPSPAVTITGQIGLCTSGQTTTWLVADTSATTVNVTTFAWTHAGPIGTNNDSLLVAAGQTGSYTVLVTGSNGCTASDNVTVNTFAPPTLSIAGAGPICTNATVDLNATAVAGGAPIDPNGYLWYLSPATLQVGNTSVFTVSSAGTYFAYATDTHGCRSTSPSNSIALAADNSPLNGLYTINNLAPASCTNYLSFKQAIADLNSRSISGNCTFSVLGGYTETAPTTGLILGSTALNAQTASGKTITFSKAGAGANPKITAYTGGSGLPTTAVPDGIFKLRGVDNVSIIQIDLADNPANTGTAMMEFGYGLFRYTTTDGAQNNTIQGCTITLNKSNDASGGGQMSEGSAGITMIQAWDSNAIVQIVPTSIPGTNSNNKFYGNTIQSCHNGIWLSGYAAPSPFTLGDTNNDIGGSSATTGNTIINYGNAGDANGPSAIKVTNQWGINISFNTIDNNNGSGSNSTNTLHGIWTTASTGATGVISGNTMSLKSGTATGSSVFGIENAMGGNAGAATNAITINANIISGASTTATTGQYTGILNSANPQTITISGNTIQNITLSGTGNFRAIDNSSGAPVVTTFNVNNNNILNNTKSSTGSFTAINMSTASSPTTTNFVSNVISGNTITGGGAACTFIGIVNGGTNTAYVLDGNTIYNNSITNMTNVPAVGVATIYGFNNQGSPNSETITDNIVRKLFVTGTSTGTHVLVGIRVNTLAATSRNILRNQVDSLYCNSGSTAQITGIHSQVGNSNIGNNKISDLFSSLGGFVKGILIAPTSTSTVKAYNNMISLDLSHAFAPAANNVMTGGTAVTGIDLASTSSTSTSNIYYNTIRLAGGGSGSAFGSSGMHISGTGGTIDLRNNITANYISPGASGFSAALRKTGAATHAATSNNNLWYTTETAITPIYYNGTAYATLAAYQALAGISPRDTLSIDDNPVFVSIATNDLHLAPGANCGIDGMAQPIATYTDDIDATNVRDLFAPDMGADEFDGTGGSGLWKGYNTNWDDPKNWCGVVPTVATNVIIPKRFSGNYPIIIQTDPVANNVTINQYASITIQPAGQLANKGTWLNNGTLTNNGTIELNGTSNQLFPNVASTGTLPAMTNLTANNPAGVTIDKAITVTGIIRPKAGALNLNNITLTLHSDASGTASVDTVLGSITYTGAGKFSVERYISSLTKVGWRFLGVPLQDTVTQTIRSAWMEGQLAPTYNPTGFGMQIVGPFSYGTGFDMDNPIPSLKVYQGSTNTWIPTAGTNIPIASKNGYMAFIRGDRGSHTFGSQSATTLRTAGQIRTGNVTTSVLNTDVNQYMAVANPYPCAVSFGSAGTTKSNLQNFYYLWDPQRGTYGAYVTFAGAGYTASTTGGSYNGNNSIESGEAVFLLTNGTNGPHSITFSENSKNLSNVQVARAAGTEIIFSTRLFLVSATGLQLYDGNRVDFDNAYSNGFDDNDAPKMINFGENLGLLRDGHNISIERHAEITDYDTIFYNLTQFRQQTYQLEFNPQNMAIPGLTGYLEDNYLHTSTAVDLAAVSTVNFTVDADPASKATDRFRIVFRQQTVVPLTFTSITANRQDKNILVSWKVDNEVNIASYDVEGSTDGVSFRKLANQTARGNGAGVTLQYNWLDEHPVKGLNYYRIKSIANSGATKYSLVVKVNMNGEPALIAVYPNPVTSEGIIRISMTNEEKGTYGVKLLNAKGQVVLTRSINHEGGNSVYEVELKGAIAHGNYMLQVAEGNKVKTTIKIVY